VDLSDQADGDRKVGETRETVVHRAYVVDDLANVRRRIWIVEPNLGRQQVLQGALGPLDLARQHRLLAHVHEDEEVRAGKREDGAVEPAERVGRLRQKLAQPTVEVDGRVWR